MPKQPNNKQSSVAPVRSLRHNALFNTFYRVANVLFPLVTSIYLSRILLPFGVGQVAFAQTIVSYFVLLASLGIPAYGIREIAKACDQEARDHVFSELFLLNLLATALSLILYLVFFFSVLLSTETASIHLVFCLAILLNAFNIDWLFQGAEDFVYISIRSITVKVLVLVSVLTLIRSETDTALYAVLLCLGTGGNYLINMFQLKKFARFRFEKPCLRRHLKPIMTLFAASVASELYARLDITMLGGMGFFDASGYYSNGHSIVNACLQLLVAVTAVYLPKLSQLYKSNPASFSRLVNQGLAVLIYIGAPLFVGLNIVSNDAIVLLFGEAFQSAANVVHVLSPMLLIKGIGDLLCYQVLLAVGAERYFIPSRIIGLMVNAVMNALLIPLYLEIGAAVASTTSELLLNLPLLIISIRYFELSIDKKFLVSTALSLLAMTGTALLLQFFIENRVMSLIAVVLLSMLSYGAMSLLTDNALAKSIWSMLKKDSGV